MKLHIVEEPPLLFHSDGQHVDIRAGLVQFGPFDKGSDLIPSKIRIGVIGTNATVDALRDWIEKCGKGVESGEQKLKRLRPSFPGSRQIFGTVVELSDPNTRTISRNELSAALAGPNQLQKVVDVFVTHARDMAAKGSLHVLVVAPPAEAFALGDATEPELPDGPIDDSQDPTAHEDGPPLARLNFHDLFKAAVLHLQIPCQIIRPDTYGAQSASPIRKRRLQDESTRAWNFFTAIYYKAGGVPWRLARRPSSLPTCYVGVSFFRSLDGERIMTSVAQIFDERGEGLVVQGGNASYDKDDRTPHLSDEDARRLLAEGLSTYRREHRAMPARLVMHKTSHFNEAEIQGFSDAAANEKLDVLDLVSVRRSGVRVLRAGASPMVRGTSLLFDAKSGIVYLKGTIPYFGTYPGAYIPRALEFLLDDGETSSTELSKEFVGLSKLNFNNTQFDTGDPITIRAARRVGDILKHVSPGAHVNARFRYFT